MNITVEEMKGLLSGRAIPADMFVNEDMAQYLVRKFAEMKEQRRIIACENVALKSPEMVELLRLVDCMISDHVDGNCGNSRSWIRHIVQAQRVFTDKYEETPWGVFGGNGFPSTDAVINSLRAEGVEIYADELQRRFDAVNYAEIAEYTTNGQEDKVSDYGEVEAARQFAEQIRNGGVK